MKIHPFIFISIIFFASCKKDLSNENGTGNPVGPSTPTTLSKIYWLDTTATRIDTFQIQYFTYDGTKRITNVTTWQKDPAKGMQRNEVVDYFYTGTDTLSNHAVYTYYYRRTAVLTDTVITHFYYTYDVNKKLIKDSANSKYYSAVVMQPSVNYWVYKYTYSANQFVEDFHNYSSTSTPTDMYSSSIYLRTYNSFGIVTETEGGVTTPAYQRQYFYNDKINPVYKTRPCNYPVIYTGNGLQFMPDNHETAPYNFSKITLKQYDPTSGALISTENREYLYEFNASGLPIVMRVKTDLPSSHIDYNKYIFVYQ